MAKHIDCAEAWRDQTGKHRDVGTVFYRGDTIYSYGRHFPMARLVKAPNGETVVFVTTGGYSGTTATHLGIMRGAVKAMTSFDVPNVLAEAPEEHAANFQGMNAAAKELDGRAERARDHGDHYRKQAKDKRNMAKRYAKLFDLKGIRPL